MNFSLGLNSRQNTGIMMWASIDAMGMKHDVWILESF